MLTRVPQSDGQPAVLLKKDWHERISQYVDARTDRHGIGIADINRDQKRQLLLELVVDGAFGGKHAEACIARASVGPCYRLQLLARSQE